MAYKDWDPDEALANLHMEKALEGMDNTTEIASRLFKENLPMAAMSICHMAVHSLNEGMRYNAAKYVVDRTLGPVSVGGTGAAEDGQHIWQSVYDSVLTEAASYLQGEDNGPG